VFVHVLTQTQLLSATYGDRCVRSHAVERLNELTDTEVVSVLDQVCVCCFVLCVCVCVKESVPLALRTVG